MDEMNEINEVNETKPPKKIFKVFLILGAGITLLSFSALVICCIAYPTAINFLTPATIPPAVMVLIALYGFCLGIWGKIDPRKKYGFKYSKLDGKAYVERNDYPRVGKSYAMGSVSFLVMSLILPFVFFFSDNVKYLVGGISFAVMVLALVGFLAVVFVIAGIGAKEQREKEKAEAERLRREQEKREEMGKWK